LAPTILKRRRKSLHDEPVAKIGYFCAGSCSFSPLQSFGLRWLRNMLFLEAALQNCNFAKPLVYKNQRRSKAALICNVRLSMKVVHQPAGCRTNYFEM
jgi:hypothetical protein